MMQMLGFYLHTAGIISQTLTCSHTANLDIAKPRECWHSDKECSKAGQTHGTQSSLMSTHYSAAHLHLLEEDIFGLRWVRERCKEKTTSTLRTEKRPYVRLMSWNTVRSVTSESKVSLCEKSLTDTCVNTHLCLPRPKPPPWPRHQ